MKLFLFYFRYMVNPYFLRSLYCLSRHAIQSSYRGSFLGMAWSMIQPAAMIFVLASVFSIILKVNIKNYALYLISGLLVWNWMLESLTAASTSITHRSHIFKQCPASKLMLVSSDIISRLYFFFISFIVMYFIVSVFFVGYFNPTVVLLPFAMIPLVIFGFSFSIFVAYYAAYVKDIGYFVTVGFNILYWSVPIIYPIEAIPEQYRVYFLWNPLTLLIRPCQDVVYFGVVPSVYAIFKAFIIAFVAMTFCFIACNKIRKKIIYYL